MANVYIYSNWRLGFDSLIYQGGQVIYWVVFCYLYSVFP